MTDNTEVSGYIKICDTDFADWKHINIPLRQIRKTRADLLLCIFTYACYVYLLLHKRKGNRNFC